MYQNPISGLHNSSLPSVSEARYSGHRHGYSDCPQALPLPQPWPSHTGWPVLACVSCGDEPLTSLGCTLIAYAVLAPTFPFSGLFPVRF